MQEHDRLRDVQGLVDYPGDRIIVCLEEDRIILERAEIRPSSTR